jgi:hypothetical protein
MPPAPRAAAAPAATRARASSLARRARRLAAAATRDDVAFAFHAAALALYARVWAWHASPAAAGLPGAAGFGWFFRYLTFYSYTLQLAQLAAAVAARLARRRAPARAAALAGAADRLACATFGLANTVTALYFAIETTTAGLVEGGVGVRPWWLNAAVHVANSVVAWGDLLVVEERAFCGRARRLAIGLGVAYCGWLLLVRRLYGKFPYPFLNVLPQPWGTAGVLAAALAVLAAAFELGAFVKNGRPSKRRRAAASAAAAAGGRARPRTRAAAARAASPASPLSAKAR